MLTYEHAPPILMASPHTFNTAGPLAAALGLRKQAVPPFARFGCTTWMGTFAGVPVLMAAHGVETRLGCSRVGTEFAVFLANLICQTYGARCRAVINAGTAGATARSGLQVADVVIAEKTLFFDGRGQNRVVEESVARVGGGSGSGRWGSTGSTVSMGDTRHTGSISSNTPSLLRTESGNAMYNPAWTKSNVWCRSDAIAAATRLRTAIVGTGSSFDLSPANAADIEKFGVAVKEMEAAAVVWSCNQFGVPCICLKSITDIVREGEEGT